MANRNFRQIRGLGVDDIVLAFSFAPNGTSAVDQTSIKGRGVASVARNSAGNFTVTLEDKYAELLGVAPAIAHNANTDLNPQLGAVDVVSAKTLVLRILAAGVETDIAAHANNRVYMTLFLRNSSVE